MNYWDVRYSQGLGSGCGSYGLSRMWKWNKILKECKNFSSESTIDFGCGDLGFWGKNDYFLSGEMEYIGIDQSEYIININQLKFPNYRFYKDYSKVEGKSDNILFFDVMFHILEESELVKILDWLNTHYNNNLFIHTWFKSPKSIDETHQHYWSLDILDEFIEYKNKKFYRNPFGGGINSLIIYKK